MGLTKQYLRYSSAGVFGLVGSNRANVQFVPVRATKSKYCAVAACENVLIWDLRSGEKIKQMLGDKHEVTVLARSPAQRQLAVGYSNGSIRMFDLVTGQCHVTFNGHKSAVTALSFDKMGMRLVSGAKDTEIAVWDLVNESGLYRLRGHKGSITQAKFCHAHNILITSAADTYVKFWDLETQHCFKTLVEHRTEVWDFLVSSDDSLMVTGSGDSELRVYTLQWLDEEQQDDDTVAKKSRLESEVEEEEENNDDAMTLKCQLRGSLMRFGKDRVVSMAMDPSGLIFGCHGSDSLLELFRLRTPEEMKKHIHKKEKKARKRARDSGGGEVTVIESVEDHVLRLARVQVSAKLRAFDLSLEGTSDVAVIALMNNNSVERFTVSAVEKKAARQAVNKLHLPGHRKDVRTMTFSSDNTAVMSAGGDTLKVWNRDTLQCICTIPCEYSLCSTFAPGDRHVVVGTKSGKLQLFDLSSSALLEEIPAHSGAVWSIALSPDKRGLVSGSADKEVKFWNFELVTDDKFSSTRKRLTLEHTRTLQMSEDVLCVKYSQDYKLLAVSLLDSTVKVFYADTLKFFLSLYGHKLPVLCLDISSDSRLIVTGSADRNVKLWGLDFGDCHKSIFAHDDSIMCVQFIPKTRMFFTGGKDKKIKQWDGDTFEHILTLDGHHAEVWSLAISPSGNFLASASHDKSLRLWEKTDEPLVLEEEKEMEREREFEESLAGTGETVIPGETNKETGVAGKKTVETLKAAERIMEAIELYKTEAAVHKQCQEESEKTGKLVSPPIHPMLQAYKVTRPDKYVMEVIKRVKSSELEESLLVLPFSYVMDLLVLLNTFIENGWNVELSCRCLFFLLRIHQGQLSSNQVLLPVMDKLRQTTSSHISDARDTIGFNLAGLQFLKQKVEAQEVSFFADATSRFKEKRKKFKRTALLTIKS